MVAGKHPSPASSSTAGVSAVSSVSDSVFQIINRDAEEEEEDLANCLILLAKGYHRGLLSTESPPSTEIYACKTCDKGFPSFQALGGHTASHKKATLKSTPLPEVIKVDSPATHDEENTILSLQISSVGHPSQNRVRVHACSICGTKFGSGQALGGHMRRHRRVVMANKDIENREVKRSKNLLCLDLNLPAPEDHDHNNKSSGYQKTPWLPSSSLFTCDY